MLGKPIVFISLDVDNTGASTVDGKEMTVVSDYSSYTDTDYVLSASYSYGRDRFIVGDFQTGLATIVLNNDTGEWSPGSGVNELGGDKLAPGMYVMIAYYLNPQDIDGYLENVTGDTWSFTGTQVSRAVTDTETASGMVDGRTWTAHVASPGDIDLYLDITPSGSPPGDTVVPSWVRFFGRIWSIYDQYGEGGRSATTVLECVDLLADLAQYNPGPLGVARSAEASGTRWSFIFDAALTDPNLGFAPDAGIYDVESSDLPNNYLEEARIAARAEGGDIYADHGLTSGKVVFKDANWLIEDPRSATVQHIIGTSRIGITRATTDYSIGRLFNDLHYSNSSTTVDVSDATSIAAYSTRSLNRTVLNNDNTDLDTIADRDLAILKDAKLVITSVEIRPKNIFEELMVVNTTVGDLLEVTIENNGWSYTQQLHVAGVSESWDAATGDWVCTLRLDSRDGATVVS